MVTRFPFVFAACILLVLRPLQVDCSPVSGTSASRGFAAPIAARLIAPERAVDVLSPAGLASSLCSLSPVTSEVASRQVMAASGIDCPRFRDYSPTGIWLEQGHRYDARALRDLRRHAAVSEGRPPFNVQISEWTRKQGGVSVHIRAPVRFAAVSALVYANTWEFAVPRSLSRSGPFHGRRRSSTVMFINGVGAKLQHEGSCERLTIPLEFGSVLRLSRLRGGGVVAAMSCLTAAYRMVVYARYTIPRLAAAGQTDITPMLKRLGATDIFDPAKQPFRTLAAGLALDSILQATELRIDEAGVGVRATTAAYTELGLPPSKVHVTYDVPFVFEVLDGRRTPVALGLVNDL